MLCVCVGFLKTSMASIPYKVAFPLAFPEWPVFGSLPLQSINHTYNIKVKRHEIAIFVTAYLVAKLFNLFSKTLTKWKWLGSI